MTQLQYECKKIQNYTKFSLNVYNPVQLIILQDVITLGILGKQKKITQLLIITSQDCSYNYFLNPKPYFTVTPRTVIYIL